jgi:hypothetical protein
MKFNVKVFEVANTSPAAKPRQLKSISVDAGDSDQARVAARAALSKRHEIRSLNISTNPREIIAYVWQRRRST